MRIFVVIFCILVDYTLSIDLNYGHASCFNVTKYWFKNKLNNTSSFSFEGMPQKPSYGKFHDLKYIIMICFHIGHILKLSIVK